MRIEPFEYAILEWDWKGQPDWDEFNKEVNFHYGRPYFHQVDTGSDSYAVLVANQKLSDEEVQELYLKQPEL